jgi:hypothetical protein
MCFISDTIGSTCRVGPVFKKRKRGEDSEESSDSSSSDIEPSNETKIDPNQLKGGVFDRLAQLEEMEKKSNSKQPTHKLQRPLAPATFKAASTLMKPKISSYFTKKP